MRSQPADPTPRRPSRLDELALLSGEPAFAEALHVGRPNIGDRTRLLERIEGVLDRRWLTNHGTLSRELEIRLAELAGTREAVVVANATQGLELLARALDLQGEVIVPAWTFIGTAHALSWVGLTPVFVDVGAESQTIDPDAVEAAITPRTTAILGVHLWGRPCEVDRLQAIADVHGLPLIFDAAHALACSYHGRPVGGFGAAEVFSFHATKVANAAEGGAITTNDAELAERLRYTRAFGFHGYDSVVALGTNAKMSELSAAMGLTSLESLDAFVETNRRNHSSYTRLLGGLERVSVLDYGDDERHNYHYVVAIFSADAPLARDEVMAVLHAENVLARRYFYPGCHRLEPYAASARALPVTDDLAARVLLLPTGTSVGEADIETVGAIVETAMANADAVRRRLAVD